MNPFQPALIFKFIVYLLFILKECDFLWKYETYSKHVRLRRYSSDVVEEFNVIVWESGEAHGVTDAVNEVLTGFDFILEKGEAIDVDHGELYLWLVSPYFVIRIFKKADEHI